MSKRKPVNYKELPQLATNVQTSILHEKPRESAVPPSIPPRLTASASKPDISQLSQQQSLSQATLAFDTPKLASSVHYVTKNKLVRYEWLIREKSEPDARFSDNAGPGMRRSNTLRDLRRLGRERLSLQKQDDAASIDSTKSQARQDSAQRVKAAFAELEALKIRNQALEAKLAALGVKAEEVGSHDAKTKDKPNVNLSDSWAEIETLTTKILEKLGIDPTAVITEESPAVAADKSAGESPKNISDTVGIDKQNKSAPDVSIGVLNNSDTTSTKVLLPAQSDEDLRALKKTADDILDTIKTEIRQSSANTNALQPAESEIDSKDLKNDLMLIMDTFGF